MLSDEMMPYLLVILISVWGGVASYIRKIRTGTVITSSFTGIIGEVTISGFVGFVTYLICHSYDIDVELTAAMCGISAHMGSRAIFVMETAADSVLKRWALSINKENSKTLLVVGVGVSLMPLLAVSIMVGLV